MWVEVADRLPADRGRYWVFTPAADKRPADLCVLEYDPGRGWLSPYRDVPLAQQWVNWMTHWTEFE